MNGIIKVSIKNSYSYLSKNFNALPRPIQNKILKENSYSKRVRQYYNEVLLLTKAVRDPSFERYYQVPTGLVYNIIKFFQAHSIAFEINDCRGKKPSQIPIDEFYEKLEKINPEIEKREYQSDSIESALKRSRGIISHSTASGKTICIAGIVYCINVKTLILCTGRVHIDQMKKDIEKYTGRKVTAITGGDCNYRGEIVVANVQALNAIFKKDPKRYANILAMFKCIAQDEVHRCASATYKQVFYYSINAYYRFGFSGTVYREDGATLELIAATGPIISKIGYDFLTKNNYISEAKFLVIDPICDSLYGEKDFWPECLKYGIVNNEKRNNWIVRICKTYIKHNHQMLVLTPLRTQHGKILEKLIPSSVFIYGESDNYERRKNLERFANKEFKVIIASNVFDEIINLPDLNCVFLAGGGKAHNAVYQRIGRGIRKAEGKSHVDVIIPWDSHSSILLRHSKRIVQLIGKVKIWQKNIKFIGNYRKNHENRVRDVY